MYHHNMKIGQPHQYIPSESTVSRDVRMVFMGARKRIAELLRVSNLININMSDNRY